MEVIRYFNNIDSLTKALNALHLLRLEHTVEATTKKFPYEYITYKVTITGGVSDNA